MRLSHLCARLRADVTSARYRALFESARLRELVFAEYAEMQGVLEVLERACDDDYRMRTELICALLREHQRSRTAFWVSALLVVFAPMLLRLRARIGDPVLASCDVDQVILEGFLVAVATQRSEARPSAVLCGIRRRTHRLVFRQLAAERAHLRHQRELEHIAESLSGWDSFQWASPRSVTAAPLDELASTLFDVATETLSPEKLEMVTATCILQVPLRNYLAQRGKDSAGGEATYQRAKREHSRTMLELRPSIRKRVKGTGARQMQSGLSLAQSD